MAKKWPVIWASIKGFGIPALIALGIVLASVFSPWQPSEKVGGAIKSFFAALFFVMYFYGQFKRVEKQTEDKEAFKGVSEKLGSLEELVKNLNPAAPAVVPNMVPPEASSAISLVAGAKKLLHMGHPLAALLQAGVAFEHSVRGFARHFKVEMADRIPLLQLMQRLELVLPKNLTGELHALRQVRNRVTHISENELSDLPDAEMILRNYEWAISELERSISEPNAKAA